MAMADSTITIEASIEVSGGGLGPAIEYEDLVFVHRLYSLW